MTRYANSHGSGGDNVTSLELAALRHVELDPESEEEEL
jgi:hypothetical protein